MLDRDRNVILGKFEASGQLGEELYNLTMESRHDAEIGDVGGFGWYALVTDYDSAVESRKVHAIVSEDTQGFFSVEEYDSANDARMAWTRLEKDFIDWYGAVTEEAERFDILGEDSHFYPGEIPPRG